MHRFDSRAPTVFFAIAFLVGAELMPTALAIGQSGDPDNQVEHSSPSPPHFDFRWAKWTSCKPVAVEGSGRSPFGESSATRLAIEDWEGKVSRTYGKEYSKFDAARAQISHCKRSNVGSIEECTVRARPCLIPR
jgi:hypothetical protein